MYSFPMRSGAAYLTETKRNGLSRVFTQVASSFSSEVQNTVFPVEEFELKLDPLVHQSR